MQDTVKARKSKISLGSHVSVCTVQDIFSSKHSLLYWPG